MEKYLSGPASYMGAGDAVKAIGSMLSTVELEELKTRIGTVLEESGKKVVVLMDDIDRLDKNEIQAVFRLVKLTADFKNTAYVLAFDAEMVASALQNRYSDGDPEAGRNFLEKIIQVPLDLPQISTAALREYCFEVLQVLVTEAGIELSDDDARDFVREFEAGLLHRLKTPRMVKRYGNILSFSLPILKGEVHPVDLMLIEGMRVFYPNLYTTVKDHGDLFIQSGDVFRNRSDQKQDLSRLIDSALGQLGEHDRSAAMRLLERLFPRVQHLHGGVVFANGYEEKWTEERRVASRTYFQRYFSYAVPEGQASVLELDDFITSLTAHDDEVNAERLGQLVGSKNAQHVIEVLRAAVDSLGVESAKKLILTTSVSGLLFPNPEQLWSFKGAFAQAAMLVSNLIGRVVSLVGGGQGFDVAAEAVRRAHPLEFACELLDWIQFEDANAEPIQERGGYPSKHRPKLPREYQDRIGSVLADRIRKFVVDPDASQAISFKLLNQFRSYAISCRTFTLREIDALAIMAP